MTKTDFKSKQVKFEVLMLIKNENPLFYLIYHDVVRMMMEMELFAFNEEEGEYFGYINITRKGEELIKEWLEINN